MIRNQRIDPFTREEFSFRVERVRALMTEARLDALLVTSEANYRYLTGFVSQFWLSPTRPWYFVLPREGEPIAIIPEVGIVNFRATSWVERLETWPSPRPEDEGVSLVVAALGGVRRKFARLGVEIGPESRLGITAADFLAIRDRLPFFELSDANGLIARVRMVKSEAETARIRFLCQAVCDAYDAVPTLYTPGNTEEDLIRKLHSDIILRGADKAPYLIGVSGSGGYRSAIMGPTARIIEPDDVLIVDTGSTYDGYYCDFNRNWAFRRASAATKRAYDVVWKATEAAIQIARPGVTASALWRAQHEVLSREGQANLGGRMGHGIGLHLTEPPSHRPGDETELTSGMVITLEPGLLYGDGAMMLHEENLVITEDGAELLTRRAPKEIPVID